jgi:LysR family transcriptional regulator, nitrogen assimilation regulatory protein
VLAIQFWHKSLVVPCVTEKGRQPIPDRPESFPLRPAKIPSSLSREIRAQRVDATGYEGRDGRLRTGDFLFTLYLGVAGNLRAGQTEGGRGRGGQEFRLTSDAGVGRNRTTMELRSLHYFVRIAELGSITRASAHLHVAQPALTRHVQRLEDELGVTLFTRANRGVRLTEGGQKLLESAQRILRDVERTGDEIRAHKAHPSGKIVLAVTPTLCPVVVPELFARMRRHYPMIELKVVHAGMVRLEEFLVDGRVDLALLSELSKSRLILSTRLAAEEMVLVTKPGARPREIVSPDELSATPLILGDGLRAAMETLLAGRGVELQVDTELNDHETIRLMVQQGVGASILPHSSVCRECVRGLAEAHRITHSGVFRTLALGVAANRGASSAREAVAEIVTQVLGEIEAEGRFRLDFNLIEALQPAWARA